VRTRATTATFDVEAGDARGEAPAEEPMDELVLYSK